jgi:hypothetical protein
VAGKIEEVAKYYFEQEVRFEHDRDGKEENSR